MFNTGAMGTVDLNADLAEGETLTPTDLTVLDVVTSASLACGFHAGNPEVMRATAAACLGRGVTIGAHVSHRDRVGFGRRPIDREPSLLVRDIIEQCEVLSREVRAVGGEVSYAKPHGALYNQMGVNAVVAASVVEALSLLGVRVLVAQAGTVVVEPARRAGLRVVLEGFPDRGYRSDGLLARRGEPGAQIDDPVVVGRRAVSLVSRGGLEAIDGTWTAIEVETLCIHGDAPNPAETARAVRSALADEGITLRSFLPAEPEATRDRRPR
jgi:5-oxoprolinase (ATP-hydrolysing) subunit A